MPPDRLDFFAGAILQGLIAAEAINPKVLFSSAENRKLMAILCRVMAEDMIEEIDNPTPP